VSAVSAVTASKAATLQFHFVLITLMRRPIDLNCNAMACGQSYEMETIVSAKLGRLGSQLKSLAWTQEVAPKARIFLEQHGHVVFFSVTSVLLRGGSLWALAVAEAQW
jgi:hypothetical protein